MRFTGTLESIAKKEIQMTLTRLAHCVMVATLLGVPAGSRPLEAGSCDGEVIVTVAFLDNQLRHVNPATGETIASFTLQDENGPLLFVSGGGLAVDPTDGQIYALIAYDFFGTDLFTVDPTSGLLTNIGLIAGPFNMRGLAFDAAGQLYGVTPDFASLPETLHAIDKASGIAQPLCTLGNGDDGEALAFDPVTDLLYHASGSSDVIFETVIPTPDPLCGVGSISIAGTDLELGPVRGLGYRPGTGTFLWKQGEGSGPLFDVAPDGDTTLIGILDHDAMGLVEVILPGGDCDFLRGDVDASGSVNLGDGVFVLSALFVAGAPQPLCADAADANDDGSLGLPDGFAILNALFIPGSPPIPPPVTCGADPTGDDLGCSDPGCP